MKSEFNFKQFLTKILKRDKNMMMGLQIDSIIRCL